MKRDTLVKEHSSGGVVFKKDKNKIRYLLIKDANSKWTIPKGHIEEGENVSDAALREIREETGITNLQIARELEGTRYFFCRGKDLILKTVYLFLIEAKSVEKLNPNKKEIKGAMWFTAKDAVKNIGYNNIKEMFNKATRRGNK